MGMLTIILTLFCFASNANCQFSQLRSQSYFDEYKPPPTMISRSGMGQGRSRCLYAHENTTIEWRECYNRPFDCIPEKEGCPVMGFNWNCRDHIGVFKLAPQCFDENGLEKQGCLWHIVNSKWICDPCCETTDCGGNLPQCVA